MANKKVHPEDGCTFQPINEKVIRKLAYYSLMRR
jgi:hypothetical protein